MAPARSASDANKIAKLLPLNDNLLVDVDEPTLMKALDALLGVEWVDESTNVTEDFTARIAGELDVVFTAVLRRAEKAGERRVFAWDPAQITDDIARAIAPLLPQSRATKTRSRQDKTVRAELLRQMEWLKWNWGTGEGAARRVVDCLWDRLDFHIQREVVPASERSYRADERYAVGDVLVHPKYGRGCVVDRTDTAISVDFGGAVRKLAAANAGSGR